MKIEKEFFRQLTHRAALGSLLALFVLAAGCAQSTPQLDNSFTSKQLSSLPPLSGPRKQVTIYTFDSSVPEVNSAAATDMFMTALVKTRRYAVLERKRLDQGVLREKQMNTSGMTTGNVGQSRLTGADYIFEGTVSEANADASHTGVGATVRGLGLEGSGQKALIAVDVRVVDAHTGAVLDAIDVRHPVKQNGASLSGIGAFAQSFIKGDLQGADMSVSHGKKEGIDRALRECMEEAVYQIARRW